MKRYVKRLNLILLALLASTLVFAATAVAKNPHVTTGGATLTASYDSATQHLSIAGCGYEVAPFSSNPIQIVYTHPDATTETHYAGAFGDGGCLGNNDLVTSTSGTWTITTYQGGAFKASTTITIP